MKQDTRLFRTQNSLWSFLDSNPQFFREVKGKLKTKNIIIAAALSVTTQFLSVIFLLGKLPDLEFQPCGRYGTTLFYGEFNQGLCYTKNDLGDWIINWQLWWLDLFIILSFISIAALLVLGTYILITDLVKEEKRGTLNFIRLSPQSASSVLLGKLLGVPILVYTTIAFLFPLHLVAGLQSHIPLSLILAFDITMVASCAFFYLLAMLWSLIDFGIDSGFKSWLFSGVLGSAFLFFSTIILVGDFQLDYFSAWILIFHPGTVIAYLIDAASLPFSKTYFLSVEDLTTLSFYGRSFWTNTTTGISLILVNLCLWTYCVWSVLKRRFHNPERTLLSKLHSYYLTLWFIVIALGFTLQKDYQYDDALYEFADKFSPFQHHLNNNFLALQVGLSLFGLGLIFALTPNRQTLYDWARYRHQINNNSLAKELILGENSPSILAIGINLAIAIAFIIPSMLIILAPNQRYLFWGFFLSATNIMLCAVIVQFIQTNKSRSVVWSVAMVASIIIVPPLCLGVVGITSEAVPSLWLFGLIPTNAVQYASTGAIAFTLLGQWLAISVIGLQMTRKLKQAGRSQTKILMSRTNSLED